MLILSLLSVVYEKCNADGIYKIKETYSSLPNGNEIEIKIDVNELQCGRSCYGIDECKAVSYRNNECVLLRNLTETQNDSRSSLDPTTVWSTYQTIGCDEGWELFQFHCYFYIAEQFNWPSCITACNDLGTHVVTITSERENNFICDLRKSNGYNGNVIIGGIDQNEEGNWELITSEPFVYSPWARWQPSNSYRYEHCMVVKSDGTWNDFNCRILRAHTICEKEKGTL